MKKKTTAYRALTGRRIEVSTLTEAEREFLSAVVRKYLAQPDWNRFAAWWVKEAQKRGLSAESPAYAVCDDLEARLGIAQGKTAPPDYRHVLLALIEDQYGSRYKFCKDTGVDQGQLSRILAGRGDFSMESLSKVLGVLNAALVVQTKDAIRESADAAGAGRILQAAVG